MTVPSSQHKGSAGARAFALGVTMLVIYLSTVPFEGWHNKGVAPFAFFFERLPRYWTWFDVLTNLAAYAILSAAWLLAAHPFVRGLRAIWVVSIACSALSFSMEALQTYNPARYPQLLDWALNTLGALAGAAFANQYVTPLLETGWLRGLRRRWFTSRAGLGILLALVWPLLSYFPSQQLFATGRLVDAPITTAAGSLMHWLGTARLGSVAATEFISTLFGCLAFAALCLEVLKPRAPRLALVAGGLLAACSARALAVSLSSQDLSPLAWLTPGAQLGLIAAFTLCIGLAKLPATTRRWMSLSLLLVTALVSNVLPQNVYHAFATMPWATPTWNNLRSSVDLLATIWPFAGFLFVVAHRKSSPHELN